MPTIYLVGLMGAGKTFWGHKLSHYINGGFIDLDEWIAQQQQQSVAEIFAQYGEDHFRRLEHRALVQLPAQVLTVVATGGGAPCFFENMAYMLQQGVVVWIHPPLELLTARIWKNKQKRPLIANMQSEAELLQYLQTMLQKRQPFYQQAHLMETSEHIDLEKLWERILAIKDLKS